MLTGQGPFDEELVCDEAVLVFAFGFAIGFAIEQFRLFQHETHGVFWVRWGAWVQVGSLGFSRFRSVRFSRFRSVGSLGFSRDLVICGVLCRSVQTQGV